MGNYGEHHLVIWFFTKVQIHHRHVDNFTYTQQKIPQASLQCCEINFQLL